MAIDRKALRLALRDALQARMTAAGDPKEFLTRDIDPATVALERLPLLVVEAADAVPAPDVATEPALDPITPPVHRLLFDVTIYAWAAATATDPDAVLDDLATSLEAALERRDGERPGWWTTLGNRCVRACPRGRAQRDQLDSGVRWVTVPVELEATRATPGKP